MDILSTAKEAGLQIFEVWKANAKSELDALNPAQKQLAQDVLKDYAIVSAKALAGVDVSEDMKDIEAQTANLKSAGATIAARAVNKSLTDSAKILAKILVAVAI